MTGIESHRSLSITFEWGYELPRPSTPSLRSSAQDSALRLGSLAQDSSTLFAQLDVGCRDQLFNFEVGTRWGWSPRRRPKVGASDVILRERSESKGGEFVRPHERGRGTTWFPSHFQRGQAQNPFWGPAGTGGDAAQQPIEGRWSRRDRCPPKKTRALGAHKSEHRPFRLNLSAKRHGSWP